MTLASKVAAASKDVGGKLSADKRNKEQGYDYLSADKILTVCGQALAEQGVTVFPAILDLSIDTVTYVGRSGEKSRYDARVQFLMKVADGEEAQELMWFGLGSDYSVPDKAVYKAITSGHKYLLMKLLNVGAGNEDGENEAHEEGKVVARQPVRQEPQRQPTPAPQPTNGTRALRPGEQVWADWTGADDAKAWAVTQRKFNHDKHLANAYEKVRANVVANGSKKADDMWQAWWQYVTDHEPQEARWPELDTDAELDDLFGAGAAGTVEQ